MKKRLFALIAAISVFAVLLTSCGSAGGFSGGGTLKVGVRNNIVNFGYLNDNTGKFYGLEVDLAKELGKRLGYGDVELVPVLPENREEKLKNGEADCLAACYTITKSREAMFDFSPAYYNDHVVVMAEKSSMLDTLSDLKGKRIGIREGSDGQGAFAAKMKEKGLVKDESEINFVSIDSYDHMADALEEGSVDVVVMDGCITHAYLNDDRIIFKETLAESSYGVTTLQGSELSAPIADAVKEMIDDGTVAKLTDKWD